MPRWVHWWRRSAQISGPGRPREAHAGAATVARGGMHVQVADPLNARAAQAIYAADESSTLRMSHENPEVQAMYVLRVAAYCTQRSRWGSLADTRISWARHWATCPTSISTRTTTIVRSMAIMVSLRLHLSRRQSVSTASVRMHLARTAKGITQVCQSQHVPNTSMLEWVVAHNSIGGREHTPQQGIRYPTNIDQGRIPEFDGAFRVVGHVTSWDTLSARNAPPLLDL